MKTAAGCCKFCGQIMTLQVPESFTAAMIDEEATKKCSCPEASAETKMNESIANAEGAIREFFKEREVLEVLQDLLMSAVVPLAKGQISKVSIAKGGYVGTMKPGKEGIKISLKYTTEESIES